MPQTGWKSKRGTLAARTRHHGADDPDVVALSQEFAVTQLEQHIRKIVDTFPPLTDDQRNSIAALLRPAAG